MPIHRVRYCLRCGQRLVRRDDNGAPRPTCPDCGYIHYRNPAPAAGVILARGGEILMVKRRFDPRAGSWCLPAGFLEYGESPERCAVRELREETGIRARLTGLIGVYAGIDDPRLKPGDDAIEARFFPLGRLPRTLAFASHDRAIEEFRDRLNGRA
jgi:8-oxo-dGTP pyrophosphatase MutT (NUDIX family)